MKKQIAFFITCVLILTGCVETSYVMPDYVGKKIKGRSLIIVYSELLANSGLGNELYWVNELDRGITDFRELDEVFMDNFRIKLLEDSTFDSISFVEHEDMIDYRDYEQRVFDSYQKDTKNVIGQFSLTIPEDGKVAKADSVYGDFVLFIQKGRFFYSYKSRPLIRASFVFVIWDNNKKQIVSYGGEQYESPYRIYFMDVALNYVIDKMAEEIFINSPFENSHSLSHESK